MGQIRCRLIIKSTILKHSTIFFFIGSITYSTQILAGVENARVNFNKNALESSIIAEFALGYHDIPAAIERYTTLAIENQSTLVKQRALNIAIQYNNIDAALAIATQWVKQEPKDVPALFYLAHIALKAHDYTLAAQTLNKILALDPSSDLEEILAGISPEDPNDRETLIEALSLSPERNNPAILVLIAGLQAQNSKIEQALSTINKALKQQPKTTSYILMKANLLNALGDQEKTLDWYQTASKKNSKNIEVRLAEAKYLIKINQSELALEKLENILKDWPTHEESLFIAGLTSIDLQQYNKAENFLIRLRSSQEYKNEAYFYLAVNAERKDHDETAKAYYRLVDGNLYPVSRKKLVAILEKQNQLDDAVRFLTQERVNYPQYSSFLYLTQADVLKRQGNKKAAIRLLDEAIYYLPDDPEIIYAEVVLLDPYTEQKRLDILLKKLLEIEPNHPTYLNAYAYTLALQNRDLKQARHYAERALELAPEQASILDTLGFVAYLQNDFDTAAQALSQAFTQNPSLKIGIRYARALYMQGNLTQFHQVLKQLKQLDPNDAELKTLENLVLPQSVHSKH